MYTHNYSIYDMSSSILCALDGVDSNMYQKFFFFSFHSALVTRDMALKTF